ncbi:MAG TPA: hypothetical protein VGL63_06710 [Streptosporangiaceae bacterium]|jgi:hypothetical protein
MAAANIRTLHYRRRTQPSLAAQIRQADDQDGDPPITIFGAPAPGTE